jgi:hypothetical protein
LLDESADELESLLARAEAAEGERDRLAGREAALTNWHCESQGCALPDGYSAEASAYADKWHAMRERAEAAEAECARLRQDAELLRQMVLLMSCIHTMTNEQLEQLIANARAVIEEGKHEA